MWWRRNRHVSDCDELGIEPTNFDVIGVGAQSTLGGRQDIFARKSNKMPEFYMIFARKKYFSRFFFGGGEQVPCPPSPTPMFDIGDSGVTGSKVWPVNPRPDLVVERSETHLEYLIRLKVRRLNVCIAVHRNPSRSYGASLAAWGHTVLPTCHPTQVNTPCLNPGQPGWYSIYLPPEG